MLIGICGMWAAGKTTIARELSEKLGISLVCTDDIRRYLISSIKDYNGAEFSHPNEKIDSLNRALGALRDALVQELDNVILDSVGQRREKRKHNIGLAEKSVIVYVKEDAEVMRRRVEERGWGQYFDERLKAFEPPTEDECDFLIKYDGMDRLVERLREIM